MAFRVSTEDRGGRTVYTMHDETSGASASVLPSFGFNLFDLRLPAGGAVHPVIAAEEGWAEHPNKPGRNGIPVLFPFPNRIDHGRYRFGGKSYELPLNSAPHAIHGFAIQADWDVVEKGADDGGAFVVGRYQISKQSPEMLRHWPSDAVLEMRYTLTGRRLSLEVVVSNPTADELPWGFGIHPYFRLPFVPGGDLDRTAVILPASEYWVLEGYIPTGERRPVDERLDFREGRPIRDLKLDDVLTGVAFEGDRAICRLVDRASGTELRMTIGREFRELVVFTPPGEPGVISVEPYTQTTDAINLQARGVDAGLRVLRHDERATLRLSLETLG